jgi:hypothetical protein
MLDLLVLMAKLGCRGLCVNSLGGQPAAAGTHSLLNIFIPGIQNTDPVGYETL